MTLTATRAIRVGTGAGLLAGLAVPACAQALGQAAGPEISWWRVIGALIFCCLLGLAGAFALKYRMRQSGAGLKRPAFDPRAFSGLLDLFRVKANKVETDEGRLKLISTVRLSYQADVSLLECDGKTVMIVTTPQGAFVVNPETPTQPGGPS